MSAESKPHWHAFDKLKDGSEAVLAVAGRKLHGLWDLARPTDNGDERTYDLHLSWVDMFRAPDEVKLLFSRLGLSRDGGARIMVALKNAAGHGNYGFYFEVGPPVVDSDNEAVCRWANAATVVSSEGEVLARFFKNPALVDKFVYMTPRIVESDLVRERFIEPLTDFVVGLVEIKLQNPR